MMGMSFKEEDTHLVAICHGDWSEHEMTGFIAQMRAKAEQSSHTRILADCCNLSAPPTEFHRYLAGKDVAALLPHPYKVSVVYVEELINYFGEDVAVNLGADIRVFPMAEQALHWLLLSISEIPGGDNT